MKKSYREGCVCREWDVCILKGVLVRESSRRGDQNVLGRHTREIREPRTRACETPSDAANVVSA